MFCLQVKEYRRIIDKSYKEKCIQIVDQFVRPQSQNEINVDSITRRTVVNIVDSKEKVTKKIFDDLYRIVYRELQHDAFPRYIRSEKFQVFVQKKGEDFMKLIAFDTREHLSDRILYQPDDFKSTTISDKDIKMILNLNDDSHDWMLISKENQENQVFRSKKQYSIGLNTNFRLCKIVGMIPVSYDKAILAEINWNTRHMVDSMLAEEIPLEYVKVLKRRESILMLCHKGRNGLLVTDAQKILQLCYDCCS
jgi:hypothetical protein